MKERRSTQAVAPAPLELSDAKLFEENALKELRNAGYRITMPRVQVIRALADTDIALSAYAVHEKIISTNGKIDVVSVYRILATLQEVGLIYYIGVADGYFPCRLTGSTTRSEVVINEHTGEVLELRLPNEIIDAIVKQAAEHGFEASTIKVEITSALA